MIYDHGERRGEMTERGEMTVPAPADDSVVQNALVARFGPGLPGCGPHEYEQMRCAIAAIRAAGYAVLAVEPTDEMIEAGAEAYHDAVRAARERNRAVGRTRPDAVVPADWLAKVFRAMVLEAMKDARR